MTGKTCLVTGANRGIGKVVATELARRGARVIVVSRSRPRLDAACREIGERFHVQVEGTCIDLGSLGSVRCGVQQLSERLDHLDVLVNNAAVIPHAYETTAEGVEVQFAVNHLGPFLLTNLLLPRLHAAPRARIVNVSSNAHYRARLDLDGLGAEDVAGARDVVGRDGYRKQRRYKATKLANVLFTYALARRLQGTSVSVNAVRPGTINTGLVSDFLWPLGFLRWAFVWSTTSRGAAPIVRLALDPLLEGVTGRYFDRFRERRSSRSSYDEALQERIWNLSMELTGLDPSEPSSPYGRAGDSNGDLGS
jgi:NAD(P)-dependent dehydrogenase (short-subunit alcohol dehydrogenase family)